jgi:hypothetical protein
MTIGTTLFAGALLIAVALSLGSYIGLLIRELSADKRSRGRWEDAED